MGEVAGMVMGVARPRSRWANWFMSAERAKPRPTK